eukprot:7111676-Pyramimonas_sp.AAC.1
MRGERVPAAAAARARGVRRGDSDCFGRAALAASTSLRSRSSSTAFFLATAPLDKSPGPGYNGLRSPGEALALPPRLLSIFFLALTSHERRPGPEPVSEPPVSEPASRALLPESSWRPSAFDPTGIFDPAAAAAAAAAAR